jgi:hypothetical protein
MRTTVDVDQNLLERLRIEARLRGLSFKELLDDVLRRGLDEPTRDANTPPRYQCPTFHMGAPAARFDLDKALRRSAALEDKDTVRELGRSDTPSRAIRPWPRSTRGSHGRR